MLYVYFLTKPFLWIVPWILQAAGYFMILRKMRLRKWTAIIPFVAEWEMSGKLFRNRRTFYRPFIITAVFCLGAIYLGNDQPVSKVYMIVAFAVYGIFLIRFFWQLTKTFGRKWYFAILTIMLPPVFLVILGFGRSEYTPAEFKPEKERSRATRNVRRVLIVAVSVLEVLVLVSCVGLFTFKTVTPSFVVSNMSKSLYDNTKDVEATGKVITPEDVYGAKAIKKDNIKVSREYFYPDHSQDKEAVVLVYVIGSNLEDNAGAASLNIRQMKDATKKGDGLKFIIEAGGSRRWYTRGIEDGSYGRYEIADGKLTKVKDLPKDTCMVDRKSLSDFISWTGENYDADRYMMVLWDHGGGVQNGYGSDQLNSENEKGKYNMTIRDIAWALEKGGIRFDVLGFDACLMQNVETAMAVEPYSDFYLASEETEPGGGWFYSVAFGELAADPSIDSRTFGRKMVACYDPYNKASSYTGKIDRTSTLSFVDLPRLAASYDSLESIMDRTADTIASDSACFNDIATAAGSSYGFTQDIQIDLVGFLRVLNRIDYNESICSEKEMKQMIKSIQSSVLFRNGASAKGINGISMAFPYKSIATYGSVSEQLEALSFDSEKLLLDEVFSIMAAQQKKGLRTSEKDFSSVDGLFMSLADNEDMTGEDWYIKGFEDYDDTKAFTDIPLKETNKGYQIELPEKAWKIISDCQTVVYQKVKQSTEDTPKKATRKYLGKAFTGEIDNNGHPTVAKNGSWIYIEGNPVCYEADKTLVTDKGRIYTGKVKARLNDRKDIVLHIEWNPVKEAYEIPSTGYITGYEDDTIFSFFNSKGLLSLQAGDRIQFIFDYYDDEGKLIKTKATGDKMRISRQNRLDVTYDAMEPCEIQFGGVLTDVYQRTMTTELVDMDIE